MAFLVRCPKREQPAGFLEQRIMESITWASIQGHSWPRAGHILPRAVSASGTDIRAAGCCFSTPIDVYLYR